ncbi:hypothetical protein OG21DRAFT_1425234 [Imleria badia]|nr:hypothetical protein OG21DRAFT_1425234 [Imleria badia]
MEPSLHRSFSQSQLRALEEVHSLLAQAGLTISDCDTLSRLSSRLSAHPSSPALSFLHSRASSQGPNTSEPSPQVIASRYIPPPARAFTADERMRQLNKVNRKVMVDAIVEHPLGALIEYPETGAITKQNVAHIFRIDPAVFVRPESEFQYSLGLLGGGTRGGLANVFCELLHDNMGNPVRCKRVKTSCRCLFLFFFRVSELSRRYYR